jgi:hypothetical protein
MFIQRLVPAHPSVIIIRATHFNILRPASPKQIGHSSLNHQVPIEVDGCHVRVMINCSNSESFNFAYEQVGTI